MAIAYLPYTNDGAAMANDIVSLAQLCTQASINNENDWLHLEILRLGEKPELRGIFSHLGPINLRVLWLAGDSSKLENREGIRFKYLQLLLSYYSAVLILIYN